jgi:hypothetical protein
MRTSCAVRHVAVLDGDGAGYDVASHNVDGSERLIEVKTTRGGADSDFFVSSNELEFQGRRRSRAKPYMMAGAKDVEWWRTTRSPNTATVIAPAPS